jgi:Mycothiol maleylpyruvate isomerase N-terminal domain
MTTRDEIAAAFTAADQRLTHLTPWILARPDALVPDGEWTVRDTLCHVAARADGVTVAIAFADMTPPSDAQSPPAIEIDEMNRRQIAERRDRTIPDLLREIAAGHAASLQRLPTLDDHLLTREVRLRAVPPGTTVADLILLAGPRHEQAHVDLIARAVGADAADVARQPDDTVGTA